MMRAGARQAAASLFLAGALAPVPGADFQVSGASAAGWMKPGEVSCRSIKESGRSYWQGQFQSEERDENAFGRPRRTIINEWRCFETRQDCARWLTEMRSNHPTYLRAAKCMNR